MGSTIEPLICPSLARGIGEARTPADQGIFLGRFDPQASRHPLTNIIDSANLWDEEIFTLRGLNGLGEERLALSALDLVAKGWMAHDYTQVSERLIDIWKTFGWVIREREERPGKVNAVWAQNQIYVNQA